MKKKRPTKEEYQRLESEFHVNKSQFPEEARNVIEKSFDLLRPYVTLELPLRQELMPVIRDIMYKQNPAMCGFKQEWQIKWIDEIAKLTADELGYNMTMFFTIIASKGELPIPANFDTQVEHFARPKEPHRGSMEPFKHLALTDEQKRLIEESLEESYREDIECCNEENQLKTEYMNSVQPYVFKYFGEQIGELNSDMLLYYGVEMGRVYSKYQENCQDLLYEIITEKLDKSPEMTFMEYCRKMHQERYLK